MSPTITMDLSDMLPLGEKWKILNQLVARAEHHEVDEILSDCKDQPTSLINLVKLLLADKFLRFDLMVELLYAEDTALLNGILSKRWLYGSGENSLVDSQFLMEQLFPNVSYICRQKVLHRIGRYARHEVKVDELWNDVKQMYGFDVAFPLLVACSKSVITSVIKKRVVQLSGYQVVTLLQKYPDVGLKYFKNHSVTGSKMNPQCSPMQHPRKTSSMLQLDRIQREFSAEEFQVLFESTLPQDPCVVNGYWEWVCKVPKYKQVNMVNQAYANLYKIDLNEHPNYMNEEYIFLLPEERRLQVVEWQIENGKRHSWSFRGFHGYYSPTYGNDRSVLFLPLKPISHSAPELKRLLLIEQDVDKRATLCEYLIETCYFNDDLPELLNVLKLLSTRTRNDRDEVRSKILSSIKKINKMEFSKEHWDVIMELIQVSLVFKDGYDQSKVEPIIRKYILFKLQAAHGRHSYHAHKIKNGTLQCLLRQ